MNIDLISFLRKSINEKKLSHAFLIETNNFDNIIKSIIQEFYNAKLTFSNNYLNNPSILLLKPNDNQIIDKDQILNLQSSFKTLSYDNSIKIYFILGVELMTKSAINKLLKFLEEPAKNIYGFLFTSDINLIMPTVKSRCECFSINDTISITNPFEEIVNEIYNIIDLSEEEIIPVIFKLKEFEKGDIIKVIRYLNAKLENNLTSDNYVKYHNLIMDNLKRIEKIQANCNLDLILTNMAIELEK